MALQITSAFSLVFKGTASKAAVATSMARAFSANTQNSGSGQGKDARRPKSFVADDVDAVYVMDPAPKCPYSPDSVLNDVFNYRSIPKNSFGH